MAYIRLVGTADDRGLIKILTLIHLKISWERRKDFLIPTQGHLAGCSVVIDTTECPILNDQNATYSGYKQANTLKYEGIERAI